MKRFILSAALLLPFSVVHAADNISGDYLLAGLTDFRSILFLQPPNPPGGDLQARGNQAFFSFGYMAGISDFLLQAKLYCPTPDVQPVQQLDAVLNFLRANPQLRQLVGSQLVRAALQQTWPCP